MGHKKRKNTILLFLSLFFLLLLLFETNVRCAVSLTCAAAGRRRKRRNELNKAKGGHKTVKLQCKLRPASILADDAGRQAVRNRRGWQHQAPTKNTRICQSETVSGQGRAEEVPPSFSYSPPSFSQRISPLRSSARSGPVYSSSHQYLVYSFILFPLFLCFIHLQNSGPHFALWF